MKYACKRKNWKVALGVFKEEMFLFEFCHRLCHPVALGPEGVLTVTSGFSPFRAGVRKSQVICIMVHAKSKAIHHSYYLECNDYHFKDMR